MLLEIHKEGEIAENSMESLLLETFQPRKQLSSSQLTIFTEFKKLKVNSSVTVSDVCSQVMNERIHEVEKQLSRCAADLSRHAENLLTAEDERTRRVLDRLKIKPLTYNCPLPVPEDSWMWSSGDSSISNGQRDWFPQRKPCRIPTMKTSGDGICHLFCYLNICTSDLDRCL